MAALNWETDYVRYGQSSGGLVLAPASDAIPPGDYARLTNAVRARDGSLTSRAGITAATTAGAAHHSVARLNNPQAGAGVFTRVWGVDGGVRVGAAGALGAAVSVGFSGNPLALVPAKPPLSGASWMFVGDSAKMIKVSPAALALPIGLPAPGAACTTVLAASKTTLIDQCDAGFAASVSTGGVPVITYVAGKAGNAINIAMGAGAATGGYFAAVDHGFAAIDCTLVAATAATDDDLIHLWIRVDRPDRLVDMKVYFVASAFTAGVIPGNSTTQNTDAYFHSFRPGDFQVVIEQTTGPQAGARRKIGLDDTDQALARGGVDTSTRSGAINTRLAQHQADRLTSDPLVLGRGQWTEFGTIASPLRRGDFARIGSDEAVGWNTIRGVVFVIQTTTNAALVVNVDDVFLHGGSGLDSSEPGSQPYDFKVTNYDPRTGAESNGSPVMAKVNFLDAARRGIDVTPAAPFGDAAVRQRVYGRGGTANDNWYFEGQNAADGGTFTTFETDTQRLTSPTVPIDHYQPVPSVDAAGNTILAQPVPYLWGPVDGVMYAAGDPNRPGHVYYSLPDAPDHWGAATNVEVCAPSELLMNGCVFGGQSYCWSRSRLYALMANLAGTGVITAMPTGCAKGLAAPWWFAVGEGGMYFGAADGVYTTTGGEPTCLTNDSIRPLFEGGTVSGYLPIDFTATAALRMTIFNHELWVLYQDTGANRRALVLNLFDRKWRFYAYGIALAHATAEETAPGAQILWLGGATSGTSYQSGGLSDAGVSIPVTIRTGARNQGQPRAEKIYGDLSLDYDRQGVTLTVQVVLNGETAPLAPQTITTGAGRQQTVLDPFGTTPSAARDLVVDVSWTSGAAQPVLYQVALGYQPDPDRSIQRVINWDDLGSENEKYVTGVTLDVEAVAGKTVQVEYSVDSGAVASAAVLTVPATVTRKQVSFSWAAVRADLVRLRPTDVNVWKVYKAIWQFDREPPRWAKWDTNTENLGDTYCTGIDIEVDTIGLNKTVILTIDGVDVAPAFTVNAAGRRLRHLTLPVPQRGHLYRLRATDANDGFLYAHKWVVDAEPGEQANWNQNYTVGGTLTDKYVKGVLLEIDTFGVAKTVQVQVDGATVETFIVTATGRQVVHQAFTAQYKGRVLRLLPIDTNPSRCYSVQWIFDQEPLALTRWEAQETDHGIAGQQVLVDGFIVLRAYEPVTLTVTAYGQDGTVLSTQSYTPNFQVGRKVKAYVPFLPTRGVLYKYVLTSTLPFALYREESSVRVMAWGSGEAQVAHPFGNDDLDAGRGMGAASSKASAPGGTMTASAGSPIGQSVGESQPGAQGSAEAR